jgi:hypothetical protein
MAFLSDFIFCSRDCLLCQCSRERGFKVFWLQNCKSETRLHLDDGKHFFRSVGTPEVDGVWTSDFKWISMGPTM